MINVLANLFKRLYKDLKGKEIDDINDQTLETKLRQYLINIIGYKINYLDYMKEIEIALENIIVNSEHYSGSLLDIIEKYNKDYNALLDSHPYTKLLIESINSICSNTFDLQKVNDNSNISEETNIAIKHYEKYLEILRISRLEEDNIPTLIIHNIDKMEIILKKYLNSIINSNSFYNLFTREAFENNPFNENMKMILEATLLNVSHQDAQSLEQFFEMYTNFINDESLKQINHPVLMGELFEDELYVMTKRAELWYETPYYLSFMLKNQRIELPNIRLGINDSKDKKVAIIMATQTSQVILNHENYQTLEQNFKKMIPKDSHFRFYNPTHFISLIIALGILKGLGINEVQVKDYLPFRYKKIINDKQLNEEEANKYQTRLTTKNIATYMNIIFNMEGIDLKSYPDTDSELCLTISDNVKGKTEFLTYLYNLGYQLGLKYQDDIRKDK